MSPCSSRGKSTGLSFSAPALRRSSGMPETTRRCPIRRRLARGWRSKGISDGNARKRKAAGAKGKGKDSSMSTSAKDLLAKDDSSSKRCKSMEEGNGAEENSGKGKAAQSSSENGGKKHGKVCASKPLPDPHQDFIHVWARHGEATDSHSLAERLRREKISQRMKLLQDLVPGCNKVVGKAVMLEE